MQEYTFVAKFLEYPISSLKYFLFPLILSPLLTSTSTVIKEKIRSDLYSYKVDAVVNYIKLFIHRGDIVLYSTDTYI